LPIDKTAEKLTANGTGTVAWTITVTRAATTHNTA